jgi:hypothetical protein
MQELTDSKILHDFKFKLSLFTQWQTETVLFFVKKLTIMIKASAENYRLQWHMHLLFSVSSREMTNTCNILAEKP